MQQALELDYTLDEAQFAEDWSGLLTLASQPGINKQIVLKVHFFCFAGGASEYVCERRARSRGDHTSYKPQLCLLKQVNRLHKVLG